MSVAPGDVVNPLYRNEDRIGYALAVAEDAYVASRTAEVAVNEMSVVTYLSPTSEPLYSK